MSTNGNCQSWTHDFLDIGCLHSPVKPLPQIKMPTSSAKTLKLCRKSTEARMNQKNFSPLA
jgi:hypothetical protein